MRDVDIPAREVLDQLQIKPGDEEQIRNIRIFWDFTEQMFFLYIRENLVAKFSRNRVETHETGHAFHVMIEILRELVIAAEVLRSACRVLTWPLWFDAEVAEWKETDHLHIEARAFLRRRIAILNDDLRLTSPNNLQHREWIERRRDTLRSELETFLEGNDE